VEPVYTPGRFLFSEAEPMSEVLQTLKITTWYKAVMGLSAAAFLIVLAAQRDGPTFIFGSIFLIGLGEWRSHPKRTAEYRRTAAGQVALIKDVPGKHTVFGTILQIGGVGLIAYRVYYLNRP
jgi:hypothetical protein